MNLVEITSGLAKRCLNEERVAALREVYLAGRNRLSPLLRLVHGTFGVEDLQIGRAHV